VRVPFLVLVSFLSVSFLQAGIDAPRGAIAGYPVSITVSGIDEGLTAVTLDGIVLEPVQTREGVATFSLENLDSGRHVLTAGMEEASILVMPSWFAILPPLLAIILALVFKEVLIALTLGVFSGALLLVGFNPFSAAAMMADRYIRGGLAEPDHAAIVIFSMMLGGMVGIISRSGGSAGIVAFLLRYARGRRSAQVVTWLMGFFIFFDDYANTLIVGHTMRPLTDRLKVSREKLAYIVDSTAAPVASLAVISTWIGYEVSLIADGFTASGIDQNAYLFFIESIPYRFYPLLALLMGILVAASGRDFGPMLKAERRAEEEGLVLRPGAEPLSDLETEEENPAHWLLAVIPILVVILFTFGGLYANGLKHLAPGDSTSLRSVIMAADSFQVLLYASLLGLITAFLLSVSTKRLTVVKTVQATMEGFKAMLLAMVVLVLAWGINAVCQDLHTAEVIVGFTRNFLLPSLVPTVIFLSASAISFATGTSWGTMAILMPIAIPLSNASGSNALLLAGVGSVLAGSIFGDHCSPISDTTIMSSMASGSDHVDHVRTQLPYALAAGFVGILTGTLPVGLGMPVGFSLLLGTGAMVAIVFLAGKRVVRS